MGVANYEMSDGKIRVEQGAVLGRSAVKQQQFLMYKLEIRGELFKPQISVSSEWRPKDRKLWDVRSFFFGF